MTTQMIDAAQIEANALEGSMVADAATIELINDYRKLNAEKKRLEAQMKVLADLIKEFMSENDLRHLTDEFGVDLTTYSTSNTTKVDREGLAKKFGVEVIAEFISTSQASRLTIK